MMEYTVRKVHPHRIRNMVLTQHYARLLPAIVEFTYGLLDKTKIIGVCLFGRGGNCSNNNIEKFPVLELNRLVLNEGLPKNTASYFISNCLNLLKKERNPCFILSYADIDVGHLGYVYQASNWIYTGEGGGDTYYSKNGKKFHRKVLFNRYGTGSKDILIRKGYKPISYLGKHRYFYIIAPSKKIKKEMIQLLISKYGEPQPYPKGETTRHNMTNIINEELKSKWKGLLSR